MSVLLGGNTYAGVPISEMPDNVRTIKAVFDNPAMVEEVFKLSINDDPERPRAHLNVLFFNDKFELVKGGSSETQVPRDGIGVWETFGPLQPFNGPRDVGTSVSDGPGYVIVFVDNQSLGKDVWFDNVMIEHYSGKVIQENITNKNTPTMKATLYLFTFMCCAFGMKAQQRAVSVQAAAENRARILKLLEAQEQAMAPLSKPTGQKQRVIAQSYRAGSHSDSTTYRYSGGRGSKFDYNSIAYPTFTDPSDTLYPKYFKHFYLLADTVAQHEDTLKYRDICRYNTSARLTELSTDYIDEIFTMRRTRMVREYNSDGSDKRQYYWRSETTTLGDTVTLTVNAYQNGKRVKDSIWSKNNGVWTIVSIVHYGYDPLGRRSSDSTFTLGTDGISFELSRNTAITYYPDNRVKTFRFMLHLDDVTRTGIDSFGYRSDIPYTTYWSSEQIAPDLSMHTFAEEIRFPGINGLPDSMQTSATNTDNVVTRRVYHFHYNNEDNPDYVDAFDENNTTTNPNLKFKFYYETYDDGLSIDEASLGEGLAIYPNPFTSELTIHGQQRKVVDCQIALINLLGQSVFQSNLTLQPGQNRIFIPFSIPKGIYIVDITEKGKRQFSGKFVRQ